MCELATKAVNTDAERKLAAIPSKGLHEMSRNEYDIDTQYDTTLERYNVINGFVSHSNDTMLAIKMFAASEPDRLHVCIKIE
ncbi:hypothetical protein DPMN_092283 [Dreissena polymorpha]|uniref:Uncharacterized protein n=1 Tax=Dreissena polymorpha TaxID=45954 RepID=A0A9D4L229_DREPO|nr:hypothetical protein DPMN_092283 [Dreissena polymorpha]